MSAVEKRTVLANGVESEYAVFGNGKKPLVIIPGLSLESTLLSAGAVANAYKGFVQEYTLYLLDRPKNIRAGYTLSSLGEDTACAVQALQLRDICLFGVSQGGVIAQYLCARHPALVKKAVLGSTLCRPNPTFSAVLNHWIALAQKEDVAALNRDFFKKIYSADFQARYAGALTLLENRGTAEDCRRFAVLAQTMTDFDFTSLLPSVKNPVLVLGAEGDAVTTPRGSTEIAEILHCDCYLYPGYCHAVYDEAPDFLNRIADFFRD